MSGQSFEELVRIVERLRSPGGCPWDRKQTHESLLPYLIEEAYEVVDAVKERNYEALKEELGDLLLQVVFHARIAEEEGRFNIEDVVKSISRKLVLRHPHVFGERKDIKTPEDVAREWAKLKGRKGSSVLDDVPRSVPPMERAFRLQKKAVGVGFEWEDLKGIMEKMREELEEIEEAVGEGNREKLEEEAGDLLFMAINLVRFLGIHPEIALSRANEKFERRFRFMEEEARKRGRELSEMTLEEMEELWQKAKDILKDRR